MYVENNPIVRTDHLGLLWGEDSPPDMPFPNPNPTSSNPMYPKSSCGAAGKPINFPNGMFGQWSFEGACKYHDRCYGFCGAKKERCDRQFKEIMIWNCNKLNDVVSRQTCRNMANIYYSAVAFTEQGEDAFNTGQEEGCSCKQ